MNVADEKNGNKAKPELVGDRRRNFHLRPKPKHSAKNRRLRPKSSAEVFHIKKVEFWVCGVKFFLQHLVFKVLELSSFRKGIFLPLKNYWIKFFSEIFPKSEFLLTKILKIFGRRSEKNRRWLRPKPSAEVFGRTFGFLRLRSPTTRLPRAKSLVSKC